MGDLWPFRFNDEGSKEEEMEIGGDGEKMGGTVLDTAGSKENSAVVKREVKMAELRTSLSLEERQETFKKMWLERQVWQEWHLINIHSFTVHHTFNLYINYIVLGS